jgi:hypothetical protein
MVKQKDLAPLPDALTKDDSSRGEAEEHAGDDLAKPYSSRDVSNRGHIADIPSIVSKLLMYGQTGWKLK